MNIVTDPDDAPEDFLPLDVAAPPSMTSPLRALLWLAFVIALAVSPVLILSLWKALL